MKEKCLFQKNQIIGKHQTKKSSKEIDETEKKNGRRSVQGFVKNWKEIREPEAMFLQNI